MGSDAISRKDLLMDEMTEGYLDGFSDTRMDLPKQNNYSPAYVHGWLNGRDDRINKPRSTADVLRRRADMILISQEQPQ